MWQIHVDIWQNQYNIVKLKNKTKFKKINKDNSKKKKTIKQRKMGKKNSDLGLHAYWAVEGGTYS